MWFEELVGFHEENPDQVRSNLDLKGEYILSRVNGKKIKCGSLSIPSLKELQESNADLKSYNTQIEVSEIISDANAIHLDQANNQSVVQAASQFNLLEMVSPDVTPEEGVDLYEDDFTQGPACAIACGAGTIYRNYFVNVNGQIGQTASNQINCLSELKEEFDHEIQNYFQVVNGYAFVDQDDLLRIGNRIAHSSEDQYERLKGKLKIGVQWNTEVTLTTKGHEVTQVYCSALPIGYASIPPSIWEPFARLILSATYEATFHVALMNYERTGNHKLFLTLVGGGVFGNKIEWIVDAIKNSLNKFKNTPISVLIVSFRNSNPSIKKMIAEFSFT